MTDRWATGSGVAVERPATGEHLGRAVLSRIEADRASLPPLMLLAHEHAGNQREAAALWERFCASVVGVPVSRYRPEKRLVILADETGMRWHDAQNSPPQWQQLPDRRPEALGEALIACMERLEPSWPTVACATVAYNGATILIYPVHGGWSGAPITSCPPMPHPRRSARMSSQRWMSPAHTPPWRHSRYWRVPGGAAGDGLDDGRPRRGTARLGPADRDRELPGQQGRRCC